MRKLDCKIGTFRYYQAEFRLETTRLLNTSGPIRGLYRVTVGILVFYAQIEGVEQAVVVRQQLHCEQNQGEGSVSVDTIYDIEILTRHFFMIIELSRIKVHVQMTKLSKYLG